MTEAIALPKLANVILLVGRTITVFALCCAIGLQWIALQSVAWTTMLIENAKHESLTQAIAKTFDGDHPCSLCHMVQKGKASEKKPDMQPNAPRIDLYCLKRTILFLPPSTDIRYGEFCLTKIDMEHSPPTPPPRCQLG